MVLSSIRLLYFDSIESDGIGTQDLLYAESLLLDDQDQRDEDSALKLYLDFNLFLHGRLSETQAHIHDDVIKLRILVRIVVLEVAAIESYDIRFLTVSIDYFVGHL